MNERSPWWYQLRGLIFGIVYLVGFVAGPALWSLAGRPYASTASWAGSAFGTQGESAAFGVAVLCTLICWVLRTWGSAYLNADVVWNANAITDALIVQGPFRHTRSPLYLGNMFMALGVGALATPCGFGIIVLGSAAFILLLVRYETEGLQARYGSVVTAYVKSVPALLWRITPVTLQDSGHVAPSLAQGLRSEIFTGCVFLAMLTLWVFGNRAFPAFGALLAAGWIAQHLTTTRLPSGVTPPGQ
ncbi:MAG: hypothetical protein ABI282_06375 [Candidatus Baltobacteraceae bacterium]